jgi:uncharacterized protein YdaU (DUF1376 family)/predicted RNA-binding Zn-ribbon protein involved in translation (DUF1610 family)
MGKAPAFQFYAGDFLSDLKVASMNMEERGIYITLLAYSWLENGLPDNPEKLARLCGNPDGWESSWLTVSECFFLADDGKLYNSKMEEIRTELDSYKDKMRKAGRLGAEVRWNNSKAKAKLKQSYSSSTSTSTSTSTLTKKKRDSTPYEEIVEMFNTICGDHLPKVTKITESRKRYIKKLLADEESVYIEKFFKTVARSDFLCGTGENSNWKANFDWIIKESNFIKIMEGVYANKEIVIKKETKSSVICTSCGNKFDTKEKQLSSVKCSKCNEYGIVHEKEYQYFKQPN